MAASNKIQVGYIEAQDGAQFEVDAGTAAAPGLCFDNSAATGLYSPGTGQIAWSTSGKQTALRILADGKVGVDCSPTVAFEVNGTIKASAIDAPIEGTLDDWIVHAGDTNTKIGFPGNDQFSVETGGAQRLLVQDAGAKVTGTLELTDSLYWDGDTNTTIDNAGGTADFIRFKTGGITVMDIDADQHVKLHDNRRLRVGASNDIQIFHNSGNNRNYYFSPQNDVYHEFAVSNSWTLQTSAGDKRILCPANSTSTAVELYHNGSKKLETENNGIKVTGKVEASTDIIIPNDSGAFKVGTSYDLQLFHDGGSSIIRNTNNAASLYIQASSTGTNNIKCNPNGSTQLFHNGNLKLYTDSVGIRMHDSVNLEMGNASDFKIYHDASHNYIKGVTAGQDVYLQSMRDFYIKAGDNAGGYHTSIYCDNNGGVRLSYDNNPKLYTKSFGIQIEATPRVDLVGSGNSVELKFIGNSSSHRGSVYADNGNTIGFLKAGTGSWAARWHSDGKQTSHGHIWPNANNTYNLGDGSYRWGRAYLSELCLNTSSSNSILTINGASSANVVSIRNTTLGNGNVGILFSTQDHSGGREKAAIYHQETHGGAHYGGDFIFCLNTATGSAGQVGPSDERFRIKRNGFVDMTGASDVRFTLGSAGTAGTNDSNWVRGESGNIMYNAASANHIWETGGTKQMEISAGNLFLRSSGTTRYIVLGSAGDSTAGGANNSMNWIRSNNTNVQYNNAGGFHGWEVSGAEKFRINSNGSASLTGSLSQNTSDDRLKKDKVEILNALDKVNSLSSFTHKWNDIAVRAGLEENKEEVGLSAQEVQSIHPSLVDINITIKDPEDPTTEYLTIHYHKVVPLLVAAIKELSAEVAALKSSINN